MTKGMFMSEFLNIEDEHKSWGNKFIDNLVTDIRIAVPESKGYFVRNLKYMAKFAETYPERNLCRHRLKKFRGPIYCNFRKSQSSTTAYMVH